MKLQRVWHIGIAFQNPFDENHLHSMTLCEEFATKEAAKAEMDRRNATYGGMLAAEELGEVESLFDLDEAVVTHRTLLDYMKSR